MPCRTCRQVMASSAERHKTAPLLRTYRPPTASGLARLPGRVSNHVPCSTAGLSEAARASPRPRGVGRRTTVFQLSRPARRASSPAPSGARCHPTWPTSSNVNRPNMRPCCGPPRALTPRTSPSLPARRRRPRKNDGIAAAASTMQMWMADRCPSSFLGSARDDGAASDANRWKFCRSIDVNRLHKTGCLRPGWAGGWQWTRDSERSPRSPARRRRPAASFLSRAQERRRVG
jgi:hypothetical protein